MLQLWTLRKNKIKWLSIYETKCKNGYPMRTNISCGLYIFAPFLKTISLFSRSFFWKFCPCVLELNRGLWWCAIRCCWSGFVLKVDFFRQRYIEAAQDFVRYVTILAHIGEKKLPLAILLYWGSTKFCQVCDIGDKKPPLLNSLPYSQHKLFLTCRDDWYSQIWDRPVVHCVSIFTKLVLKCSSKI